jgi:very-short-patch-repair endonuclease
MHETANAKLTKNSQNLRKNMTKEERHLWYDFLKNQPITFNRQKVIGNYVVDFYCASANLVIEIDGSQHYEDVGKVKDIKRDNYLKSMQLSVLRYSNYDINNNFEGVCADILKYISTSSTASGPPSPQGEG